MKAGTRHIGVLTGAIGFIAFLLALVCSHIYGRANRADLIFSHQYHIEKAELACDICHEGAATEEKAGLPSEKTCQTCHDFDREKPSKSCLTCHSRLEVRVRREKRPEYADVIFSHVKHAGLECKDCHSGVEKSTEVRRGKYIPSMDQCVKCHAELGIAKECENCHTMLRKNQQPPSHGAGFERGHGMLSQTENARCDLCHHESYCQECHLEKEPQNHTFLWKKKAHGEPAMIDRSSCMTCHRTDFCIICHSQTRPTSHRPGWGNPRNTHCQTCHLPLSTSGCVVCHKSLESHLSVRPGDHVGNWTQTHCITCHFPLSATDCGVCHKKSTHQEAPDAAWHPDEWRDCRACHPSILTSKPRHPDPGLSCTACHRI